jgi:hypothetical protein
VVRQIGAELPSFSTVLGLRSAGGHCEDPGVLAIACVIDEAITGSRVQCPAAHRAPGRPRSPRMLAVAVAPVTRAAKLEVSSFPPIHESHR